MCLISENAVEDVGAPLVRLPWYLRPLTRCGTENRNALLNLLYTILVALSDGMTFSGVMALYIKQITGSNTQVGYAEGIFGFMALVPGMIGGYISDKTRRDSVVRVSGVISFIGTVMMMGIAGVYLAAADTHGLLDREVWRLGSWKFVLTCVAVCVIYSGESVGNAGTDAILADSLTTGDRQGYMTSRGMCRSAAQTVGPLLCAFVTAICGDVWSETTLTILIVIGLAIRIPSCLLCLMFDDNRALHGASEAITESKDVDCTDTERARYRAIPYLNFVSAIMWAFGSGMAVKFFPAFFEAGAETNTPAPQPRTPRLVHAVPTGGVAPVPSLATALMSVTSAAGTWAAGGDVDGGSNITTTGTATSTVDAPHPPNEASDGLAFPPVIFFLVSAAAVASVIPLTRLGLYVSTKIGRVQTDIIFWHIGTASLAGMAVLGYTGHYTPVWSDRLAVVVLYLGRTGFLQCTRPIRQSVTMDYVPKGARARWASTTAITRMGWSGSAALGGYLADQYSYEFVFLVTCCFHTASVLVRYPLLWIVPKEQHTIAQIRSKRRASLADPETGSRVGEPSEEDPLLG